MDFQARPKMWYKNRQLKGTDRRELSMSDENKNTESFLKRKWTQWMRNKKSRITVIIVFVMAGVLLFAGISAICYSAGYRVGEKAAHSVSKGGKKDSGKKKAHAVTAEAAETSGEAVSAQAAEVSSAGIQAAEGGVGSSDGGSPAGNKGKNAGNAKKDTDKANGAGGTAAQAAGGYAGKLSVSGNQLCANGTPIQLRGVSTHGLSWFPEYVNEAMIGELKAWGANVFRLAMYTAESGGYCVGDDANRARLKNLVKSGVEYATNQGMYVIIDWHILSDGNPNIYKQQAVAFFSEMAQLYKDNDHVLYEICNEPNGGVSWGEVKSYAQDVIAAIRQYDADGVILVGNPTWCQEIDKVAADPLTGYSNIMYTLHFYADTHRDDLRNKLVRAVSAGIPVFVSEFGICDASGNGAINTQQADLWIQTLNQYGISFVEWSLCNKAESASLIRSDCSRTNGITTEDLSESGKWLLKTLHGSTAGASAPVQNQTQKNIQVQNSQEQQNNQNQSGAGQSASGGNSGQAEQKNPGQYTPSCSAGAEVSVVNSWQEGNAFCIQYDIKVANLTNGVQDGWSGSLSFPASVQLVSGWNANFSAQGSVLSFTAMDYNKTIQQGQKAEGIGVIVKFEN